MFVFPTFNDDEEEEEDEDEVITFLAPTFHLSGTQIGLKRTSHDSQTILLIKLRVSDSNRNIFDSEVERKSKKKVHESSCIY